MKTVQGEQLVQSIHRLVRAARRGLVLVSPYFDPWEEVAEYIETALNRGVRVMIVIREDEERKRQDQRRREQEEEQRRQRQRDARAKHQEALVKNLRETARNWSAADEVRRFLRAVREAVPVERRDET